jgi:hypothetical protein
VAITALQVSYTDPTTEVTAASAYARIVGINVDAISQTIDLTVGVYATAAARTAGSLPFGTYHAWPDYATFLNQTVNVRAAAYNFLKSLTPFYGATDV